MTPYGTISVFLKYCSVLRSTTLSAAPRTLNCKVPMRGELILVQNLRTKQHRECRSGLTSPHLHGPVRARGNELSSFARMVLNPSDDLVMHLRGRAGLQRRRLHIRASATSLNASGKANGEKQTHIHKIPYPHLSFLVSTHNARFSVPETRADAV